MVGDLQMKIGLAENAFAPNCEAAYTELWLVPHLTTDDKQFSEFLSAREDLRIASPTWIHKSFNDTLPVSRIVYGAQYGLSFVVSYAIAEPPYSRLLDRPVGLGAGKQQ